MGDVPIGISYYSADVFSERESFDLEWCGGAPPKTVFKDDAFTPDDTEEQYAHNLACGNKYLKAVQETAGASEVSGEDLGADYLRYSFATYATHDHPPSPRCGMISWPMRVRYVISSLPLAANPEFHQSCLRFSALRKYKHAAFQQSVSADVMRASQRRSFRSHGKES